MRRSVLISGASGGLGRAFVWEFAAQGWDLLLTDQSDEALRLIAAGVSRAHGVDVAYRACDLTRDGDIRNLTEWIRDRRATVGALVNVAGFDIEGAFLERAADRLLALMRVNMEAVVLLTHAITASHLDWEPLRVINVASLAAFYPMPYKALYAASKRFVVSASIALDAELRDRATVTALCPAGMPTTQSAIAAIGDQGIIGRLTTMNASDVARLTYRAAMRGRAVVVPGLLNRVLLAVSGLVPATFLASLIGWRWGTTRGYTGPAGVSPDAIRDVADEISGASVVAEPHTTGRAS